MLFMRFVGEDLFRVLILITYFLVIISGQSMCFLTHLQILVEQLDLRIIVDKHPDPGPQFVLENPGMS